MPTYSSGRYAVAMCPRCGVKVRYIELRREWSGQWTCRACFDPKHPQIDPVRVVYDPQALHHPYPDNDDDHTPEVEAVDFNGTTNYLLRSAALQTLADGDA